MSTTFSGKTGQPLEIKLDSRILSAGWGASKAYAGKPIELVVETLFIYEHAPVRCTFRDGKGKEIGKSTGTVVQNIHKGLFTVPVDTEGPISFDVELQEHSLTARSRPITLESPPRITEVKMLEKKEESTPALLLDGEEYRISAKTANIPPMAEVYWTLFEQDEKGILHRVQKGRCSVKGADASGKFTLDYGSKSERIPTPEEFKRLKMKYKNPTVFAVVGCLGVEASAAPLPLRQKLRLRFWSEMDKAGKFEGKSIVVTAPDGKEAKHAIPATGAVSIEVSIPGMYTIDLSEVAELI